MTQKQGYPAKSYSVPTKRYCQTLSLKDNPALIAEYRKIHSRAESWPEIREGIRSVGILEMEMYICGTQVFMIVETHGDGRAFSFATSAGMGRLCSSFPKVRAGKHIIPKMGTDGTDVLSV